MTYYEHVCIAGQELSPLHVDNLKETIVSILEENGGKVVDTEYWGARKLEYKIKKNRKGHYLFFKIDSPPAAIHEMERLMRINESVLRFLTIRVDELTEEPSPILQYSEQTSPRRVSRPGKPERR